MKDGNCHVVQAVYATEELDDAGFIKDVKWCVLLEAPVQGANIVKHTGDTDAFQYITDWIEAARLDVDIAEITNDLTMQLIGVVVKGNQYPIHVNIYQP